MLERYQRATELLDYNKTTGHFTWKVDRAYRVRAGDRAGSIRENAYRILMIEGKPLYEHRAAWFFVTGEVPTLEIDHLNRNKQDNRWINLDQVTRTENCNNTICQQRPNYGISEKSGGYQVKVRGKYLGYTKDIEKARLIRDNYIFSGL